MRGWFTVEEIDHDTFAISEYGHWERPHSYLFLGRERAALVDTGLGVGDIRHVVRGLTALPVHVLTTHAHWDHIGGHGLFADFSIHESEREWIAERFPLPRERVISDLVREGGDFPPGFDPEGYEVFKGEPARLLRDGDTVELGGRRLTAIHTPGHSPGHCCYYEAERGYLCSGDLIYAGRLYMFYPSTDPRLFLESVRRVSRLEIKRLLPGHNELDIPVSTVGDIESALSRLEARDMLRHGAGIFDHGAFSLQL